MSALWSHAIETGCQPKSQGDFPMIRSFTARFETLASIVAAIVMVAPLVLGSAMFVAASV